MNDFLATAMLIQLTLIVIQLGRIASALEKKNKIDPKA